MTQTSKMPFSFPVIFNFSAWLVLPVVVVPVPALALVFPLRLTMRGLCHQHDHPRHYHTLSSTKWIPVRKKIKPPHDANLKNILNHHQTRPWYHILPASFIFFSYRHAMIQWCLYYTQPPLPTSPPRNFCFHPPHLYYPQFTQKRREQQQQPKTKGSRKKLGQPKLVYWTIHQTKINFPGKTFSSPAWSAFFAPSKQENGQQWQFSRMLYTFRWYIKPRLKCTDE